MVADNIYLYYLDAEVQKLYLRDNYSPKQIQQIQQYFSIVTRIAFLLCRKHLFVPLSNYLESSLAYDILNGFSRVPATYNPLVILSTAPTLKIALEKKENEHQENYLGNPSFRYKTFEDRGLYLPGEFRTRQRSASADIQQYLVDSVEDEQFWLPFLEYGAPPLRLEQLQYELADIPKRLSGKAYISEYMLPYLSINPQKQPSADREMNLRVTRWYLKSFLDELDAVCLKDIPYVQAREILPYIPCREHLSYRMYANRLSRATVKQKRRFHTHEHNAFNYVTNCDIRELVSFKYSNDWEKIYSSPSEHSEKKYFYVGFSMPDYSNGGASMTDYSDIKIGIVTALPHEFTAIKVLLENTQEVRFHAKDDTAGNRYIIGEVACGHGTHRVALCMLPRYGNNFASIISTKMMNWFKNIKNIIICGIAGGVPSKVRLGDLVVSMRGVIQYDLGADKPDQFISKTTPQNCSDFLVEAVQFLRAEELEHGCTWLKYVDEINARTAADFSRPEVKMEKYEEKSGEEYVVSTRECAAKTSFHEGVIGSGNAVQKNAARRDALCEQHNVTAIEMESSGISDAARLENHGYIAVRGICDYCDSQKNDEWQLYAAAVAAAYTYALVKSIPITV